jgi:membrane dipeptidase
MKKTAVSLAVGLCLTVCAALPALSAEAVTKKARELHERILTLDTHLDTTAKLDDPNWSILDRHTVEDSQVDYPRMVEGGLDGGFWVIYTSAAGRSQDAYRVARDHGLNRLINIHKMIAANPDKFELALTSDDARRIAKAGKRPAFISMENASPLTTDPVSLLRFYYKQGLRMMSLVHSANNEFADSTTGLPEWKGMSPAGREVIIEANRLGIVVDLSHSSDAVFDQALELSKSPIMLSHSSAKDVYAHPRNLNDERIKKMAAKGGVIQMNALGSFLIDTGQTPELRAETRTLEAKFAAMPEGAEKVKAIAAARDELRKKYGVKEATFEDFIRHVDHVLKLVGPDHVGFGADWDGGGGVLGMEDITKLPRLTQWLMDQGYTDKQIENIWSGNVLRVLDAAQKVSKEIQAAEAAKPKT